MITYEVLRTTLVKKGERPMRKNLCLKKPVAVTAAVLVAVLMIGFFVAPAAQADGYEAAYIRERDDLKVDYSEYLDSSVMYRLADSIGADQEISVIVKLNMATVMDAYAGTDRSVTYAQYVLYSEEARQIRQQISQQKAQTLKALDTLGISYSTGEEYDTLLCGYELLIRAGDYETACSVLGPNAQAVVGEVYRVAETQLVENDVNVYSTGIFNSADSGYDGTGMVVAVLDTGLDSNHSAFSTQNFTSTKLGLTYEQVAAVVSDTKASSLVEGLSVDDVYINEKVPFGFDYADRDPDVYSTHNNHGTHVSGVIVGKDDTITGVAPNAQLVSMKIFSDVVDTAMSSWILSALEDCVILDVDVINMSLGTACGFSRESDEEVLNGVYQKIRDAGISLVVAASNSYSSSYGSEKNGNLGLTSNPDTGTVGSPSTYDGALSVASINGTETPYLLCGQTIIYFDEARNSASEELNFCDTLLGDQQSVQIEYVLIPGVGRSADYTGMDVTGKIALVRRGSNTFEEKAIIAQAQGAAGIIIYNNVSGDIMMNVGDAQLAVCSISQDDGEMLAAQGSGTLTISREQTSGPFMTDFSSWGPTPNLQIKPDITAHGGNILSSITGGGYDRLSGTSMACPNLAGVSVLLRQYVVENFPEIADDPVQVNATVNRLMMSTADIILNTNGLPYSVRKQGAGLANLLSSINTPAYIVTYDENGQKHDRAKIELYDDPEKTGVYVLNFTVENFGDKALTYDVGAYVLTEGVSDTKTFAGETTVTEESYLLSGAGIALSCKDSTGGHIQDGRATVYAGESLDLTVTVTLSEEDKNYLDTSFANGMYVEGYVTLTAVEGTAVNLSVPYLAFYGDWTKAPLFDLDYYATNADELDDAIDLEDKTLADAYASRPIGGVTGDYVSYLGSYYFLQDPKDITIAASRDHISLSNQDGTIHSLRFVWAGLLRNAAKIEVTITDDTTGQIVFETVDTDVRKSYSDGGASIYPANVEIEFDTMDYNLMNNSTYTVTLTGYLDYGDGGLTTNESNTFTFPLTVDFEAPTVTDVEFYYEYDNTLKKNRLYAKVAVYDNHYAMSAQLGYVAQTVDENGETTAEMKSFEQYMTPVYSQFNGETYLTFELTDYIYEIKQNAMNDCSFVVTCYDYALNYATYEIGLPLEYLDFYFDGLEEGLTLSPNEVYTLEPLTYPDAAWSELLTYASSRPSVVRVVNNKLVAVAPGTATVKAQDPSTNKSITFTVTVLGEEDEGYRRYDKPVADVFRLDGYQTTKAYYILNNDEKEIGDTGDTRFFEGNYSLSMYPSESVYLNCTLDAYFPNDTTLKYESSNENIVKVDEYGNVTAVAEGFASVTVQVMQDGRNTYYSETVSVEVKDPFITLGASLSHYYGNGGVVSIPADLALTEIGSFAFSNYDYVDKTEEELAFDDRETVKQWFIGESTITKVIIPEGVEKINSYAFANLTALEEIVLPSTLESIEYGAFYGCTELQKVTFSGENNLIIINQNAFELCDLQGTLDLSAACVISDYAFAGNQDLEGVITSDCLLSIGQYAFAGCKSLENVTITADKVKYGGYAFTDCEALKEFYVNTAVIPAGMFYECKNLEKVSIGADVNSIGEFAFRDTAIAQFEVVSGNTAFKAQTADHILSADGTVLAAVAPTVTGDFSPENIGGANVTAVGYGAFSHNTAVISVSLSGVTEVRAYGFASSDRLKSVELGTLSSIGEYAFFETSLTELPVFTADTKIERYAFAYTDIARVTVPDHMVIAEGVFSECEKLEEVIIGNGVTLGKYAFNIGKDLAMDILHYDEDGERYFHCSFASALKSLTIGENVTIGENAFTNHASLETVTLGDNAQIGRMAFYNNSALKYIDLSNAASIGDYAFSGDVYYTCLDESMAVAAVSKDGYYIYTYHAPALEAVDIASAASIGEHAFSYCRSLTEVRLGDSVTEIPAFAFAGCDALQTVDLSHVKQVGENAFAETDLLSADLSNAESVGKYSFVYCESLEELKLNSQGTDIGEGAFSYCTSLEEAENLNAVRQIGEYAFAYTAITKADLTGAVTLGGRAFLKGELTPFEVTLGTALETVGDNPFAMCAVAPFRQSQSDVFNGLDYSSDIYTFDLNEHVRIVDGSLYCRGANGLELIVYTGRDPENVRVAEGTVRITSYAFAGSDVGMVTLPYTVRSIGHKAFFGCTELDTVIFTSYDAPILEEEFDSAYYESLEHIPGSGSYGTYTNYDGEEVTILGNGTVPYFMWNVTGGMYSNVFYGANFIDYVGYVEDRLTMVRPVNGQNYDSYIFAHYFDRTIDGAAAADSTTLAAIAAIDAIPERATYEDKALVEAARAAYARIATTVQQGLVTNYSDLISAEQRITALTPTEPEETQPSGTGVEEPGKKTDMTTAVICGLIALAAAAVGVVLWKKEKAKTAQTAGSAQEEMTASVEEDPSDGQ